MKKILLVGGGTGGHIFPLRNLADELALQGATVELVVEDKDLDRKIVKENFADLKTYYLRPGKVHRHLTLQNLKAPFKILKSFSQAKSILQKSKPDVLFFKGWLVGLPILIVALFQKKRPKIFAHESDITTSKVSQWAEKRADKVFKSFGNPSLPLFFRTLNTQYQIPNTKTKKLLIIGGSQGAQKLNELFLENAEELLKQYSITIVTGPGKTIDFKDKNFKQYELLPAKDLSQKIKESDLVVSRAGANSLFEIISAKKPSLIIPLPWAARNHQWANAEFFTKQNLCHTFDQEKDTDFVSALSRLIEDEELTSSLEKSTIQNSAKVIAEELLQE